jgi:phosphoribosylaminoimidazolecarboxamide formyltransferase/IMP cyclohydrolase
VEPLIRVRRALLSASDRTGLPEFARGLQEAGVDLIATGGTATALRAAGLAVREVSEVTGAPEILDGRVKTLHPAVHAGLLYRRDRADDEAALAAHGYGPIDLVAVTLYPFGEALARGETGNALVEMIDIGGPSLIRAAAKNHRFVVAVTAPEQYGEVLAELRSAGGVPAALAARYAIAAFARTAAYDLAVAAGLAEMSDAAAWPPPVAGCAGVTPQGLRYGENPHQRGALYYDPLSAHHGWGAVRILSGKELSYTNILDVEAATRAVAEFDEPAAVIVKHATPCGAAVRSTVADAFAEALAGDPVSAYGCVAAVNRAVDAAAAEAINATPFLEVLAAPGYEPAAFESLKNRKTRRFLAAPRAMFNLGAWPRPTMRALRGALLVQDPDTRVVQRGDLHVVTERAPGDTELEDLLFAWHVVRHARSNACVLARGRATVGIGAGTTNRLDAVRLAVHTAGERACGAVLASDGFFPMADGLEAAIAAGVTAVIQPGGSIRDEEVAAAANKAGVAMAFTGVRAFVH